jgi:hypothetical protein
MRFYSIFFCTITLRVCTVAHFEISILKKAFEVFQSTNKNVFLARICRDRAKKIKFPMGSYQLYFPLVGARILSNFSQPSSLSLRLRAVTCGAERLVSNDFWDVRFQ